MKMGFAFFIFLLCNGQNTYTMDALSNPKTDRQATTQEPSPCIDKTELLIKACKCPTATPSLIGYLLGQGGNVNGIVDNTTALLAAVDNPNIDKDPSIIHLLAPRATQKHQVLALRHAITKERWNIATLLQDEYKVVLSDDDIQEPQIFVLAPALAWARRKATAAKTGLANAIKNLRNPTPADDGNDNDNAQITYTVYETGRPLNDAEMNLATLGGMPNNN